MKTTFHIIRIYFVCFVFVNCSNENVKHYEGDFPKDLCVYEIPLIIDSLNIIDTVICETEQIIPMNPVLIFTTNSKVISYSDFALDKQENLINLARKLDCNSFKVIVDVNQSITIDYSDYCVGRDISDGYYFDSNNKANSYEPYYKNVKLFPVFIFNTSDSVYSIEMQDLRLIMIQEAIDPNGQWKPIEYWRDSWCGNSYAPAFIKPKEYLLTQLENFHP